MRFFGARALTKEQLSNKPLLVALSTLENLLDVSLDTRIFRVYFGQIRDAERVIFFVTDSRFTQQRAY